MVSFWKKIQFSLFKWHTNSIPHFHTTNFFAKEYFPIYCAFAVFSGIYIPQYVMLKLWKRIIFDVIVGGTLAIIIYFTRKHIQFTQFFLTIFFMIGSVLLDKLVNDDLKRNELLFLGIYITILYYNMIKGFNTLLSNLAFFFMLMYFSFVYLLDVNDLTTFFGNFIICILQSYMTWTDHKHKLLQFEKQNNEKKKWLHIFNNVFPGVTILFKKEITHNLQNQDPNKLKTFFNLEFINIRGQDTYKIANNFNEIESFLSDITILTPEHLGTFIPKDDGDSKVADEAVPLNIHNLILKAGDPNIQSFSLENMILGSYKKDGRKMKIWITSFEWNEEKLVLLHLDDDHLEEEIKKLQQNDIKKNELLASVTHDLRSPLNGILAFINNAKNNDNKKERLKFLHYAEINANLLMNLINDILDYSSFINDKFNLIKDIFNLRKMLSEVIDLMAIQAASKKIKLKLENDLDENLDLYSDCRRIKQILINLIGNSIKFTTSGFIKLKVLKTKYKNVLKFCIIDTGVGIKKENIEKLCKPYSTFDTQDGLNKYGIGLGLSICKKFLSLLGPKEQLKISSEYGQGTKISFFIFVNVEKSDTVQMNPLLFENKVKTTKDSLSKLLQIEEPDKMVCEKNGSTAQINSKFFYKSIEEQYKLDFSSFGSISNKSELEENLSDDNVSIDGKLCTYENPVMVARLVRLEADSGSPLNNSTFSPLNLKNDSCTLIPNNSSPERRQLAKESFENKSFRVLIADDNPFNAFVIMSYLQKITNLKIYYETVGNGDECVAKFKEKNLKPNKKFFNLIFMDCLMPIKDGYEATSEIKNMISTTKYHETAIIGVTGLDGPEEETKCLENGMDGFVGKPFTENKCLEIIYDYSNKVSVIE